MDKAERHREELGKHIFYKFICLRAARQYLITIYKIFEVLEVLGIQASAAPNSVCLSNNSIDKGTVIRWMNDCDEFDFSYKNCIAIGDNPGGNDYALTTFQHLGMPFVNCGDKPTQHDTYLLVNTNSVFRNFYAT